MITLCDGKYQIENDNGSLSFYRHGEPWLQDDGLRFSGVVLAMVQRIEALELGLHLLEASSEADAVPSSKALPNTKHTSTCLLKAADDEPIFVLRAQDKFAPVVVRFWAELALAHGNLDLHGTGQSKYILAREVAEAMEDWHTVKSPD